LERKVINFRYPLIIVGWTIGLASIFLQSIYQKPMLGLFDFVLLFILNFLAGVMIKDAERLVLGFIVAFSSSVILEFLILSMPVFVGLVRHAEYASYLYAGAITMIVRTTFPLGFVVCFLASIIGGFLADFLP